MSHKSKQKTQSKAMVEDKRMAPIVHYTSTLVSMYKHQLISLFGEEETLLNSSVKYLTDFIERMAPKDPAEELLISQMIQTHVRIMQLNKMAQAQTLLKNCKVLHEAADRAANTFRRQMLSLAEYRRPPRQKNFTAIGQANFANQQVVQNGKSENEKATNEQGSASESNDGQNQPAQLPLVSGGTGIPPVQRIEEQALAEKQRSQDERG